MDLAVSLAGGCGQGEAVDQKTSEKYRTLISGSLMGLGPIQAIHLGVLSDFILGQRSGPVKQGRETGRSEGRGNCSQNISNGEKNLFSIKTTWDLHSRRRESTSESCTLTSTYVFGTYLTTDICTK